MVLVKHERINFECNSFSTILWNFPIYKFMQVYIWQKIKKAGWIYKRNNHVTDKNIYFCILLCILLCICYWFSHLIGLFSVTWLFLLYKFTRFLNLFSVSLWRRANARHILYYPYRQYTFSYFDLYLFSAYTAYVYIWWRQVWDKDKLVR